MAEKHHYSVLPRDESRVGKKLSMAGRHHYSVLPRGESRVGEERSTAGRQWTSAAVDRSKCCQRSSTDSGPVCHTERPGSMRLGRQAALLRASPW